MSANGKTLKFEHARPWPLSKLSENYSVSEPQMYQNTTQNNPQNGSRIEEIMENRAPEHSSRNPIDQHATFNTTRGGSGCPEWRTSLDFGTLRSILAPILNTTGSRRTPQNLWFRHKVAQDTTNCGNNARHVFWKQNCIQNDRSCTSFDCSHLVGHFEALGVISRTWLPSFCASVRSESNAIVLIHVFSSENY